MDHMANVNKNSEIKNERLFEINGQEKIKKEANLTRKRTIKMENTLPDTNNSPSSSTSYSTQYINNLPPNTVDNSTQNFLSCFGFLSTDQYQSLTRLVHLFPQLHAATLKGALELCNYDTIQTIDSILYALQYRKYLEAKNQGFPLDYSVRGQRMLLLPSFLGNRPTNSNVYDQLFQGNAYINNAPPNGSADTNHFVNPNCYTSTPEVVDTSSTESHPIPQCFSGYQISNEIGVEHNFQMTRNCLPPFNHLVQYNPTHQSNDTSIRHNLKNYTPSFMSNNNSDKENVDSNIIKLHPSSVENTLRQSVVHEDKRTTKPKTKRLTKTKQAVTRSKLLDKKNIKLRGITESYYEKEIKMALGVHDDTTNADFKHTMNDCMIVESSSQIEKNFEINSHKESQCPLGDKDCNEMFQSK